MHIKLQVEYYFRLKEEGETHKETTLKPDSMVIWAWRPEF